MTTRKHAAALGRLLVALAALAGVIVGGAGCATPGPLHVYSLGAADEPSVRDFGPGRTAEVPSFLEAGDQVVGFAYDPFTDHFFLRLAPGDRIRVVDRPARAIKREFAIAGGTGPAAADLAVRPRDGHLFLLMAGTTDVLETTRLGQTVRRFALAEVNAPPTGLALDPTLNRLLVLAADGRRITLHDPQGARTGGFALEQAVDASLAFDAEKRELYAPLRGRPGEIGVFDETGKFLRTSEARGTFVDLGVRSFVRVF